MPILWVQNLMFDPYPFTNPWCESPHRPEAPKKVAWWPRIARSAREDSPLSTWWADWIGCEKWVIFELWKHRNWKSHPPNKWRCFYRKSIYKWRTFRCHCWVPKGMFMIVGRGTYPKITDVSSWRMKIPWCLWHSAILVVMSYRRCRSSILFSQLLTQWLDEPTIVGGNPAGTRCQNQRGLNSMWAVASTAMGEISNHQRLVCTEFACFIPICVYVNHVNYIYCICDH
jgi:hypothetical protein